MDVLNYIQYLWLQRDMLTVRNNEHLKTPGCRKEMHYTFLSSYTMDDSFYIPYCMDPQLPA